MAYLNGILGAASCHTCRSKFSRARVIRAGVGVYVWIDQKSLLLAAGQACRSRLSTLSQSQTIAFQGDPLQMSQL